MTKVAIIGSRNFNDYELVKKIMETIPDIDLIISGGAKGADSLGELWAKENNKKIKIFKPDWENNGRAAGVIRNQTIVVSSDLVVAFWDGQSKGTKSSIDFCKKYNIPLIIISTNNNH
jgi:hypothetical protein